MALRLLKHSLLAIAALASLYLLAALTGSLIPANRDWRETRGAEVTVHIVSNGYHSGIVVPASAAGHDLSLVFRPTDLPDADDPGEYLLIGWGDAEFYRNTPQWSDLTARTIFTAAFGSDASLIHVDHLARVEEVDDPRPLRLTRDEYRRLIESILASLERGPSGHPIAEPGYGARDLFYPARGRYSLIYTCNNWTRDRLAEAGVTVGRWTPFAGGVMRWFPRVPSAS